MESINSSSLKLSSVGSFKSAAVILSTETSDVDEISQSISEMGESRNDSGELSTCCEWDEKEFSELKEFGMILRWSGEVG